MNNFIRPEIQDSFDSYDLFTDHPNCREWLSANYEQLTDYEKFWLTVQAYSMDGYNFPRSWIMRLKKIRPDDYLKYLDNAFSDTDTITVYRGQGDRYDNAANRPSWTTDKNVAIWFYWRASDLRKRLIGKDNISNSDIRENIDLLLQCGCCFPTCYQATITKDKIIATINDRNEFEILQHRGVKDIQEIIPTDQEIKTAIELHSKSDI